MHILGKTALSYGAIATKKFALHNLIHTTQYDSMAWRGILGFRTSPRLSLKGKRVWIVGASSGIGAALAYRCAEDGAQLALSARSTSILEEIVHALEGSQHVALPADVTDMPSLKRAWKKLSAEWGVPDVVLCCAGIYQAPRWDHFSAQEQIQVLDTNVSGTLRILELLLPEWKARRSGLLVLFGSFVGLSGARGALAYGASKAATRHLAESLLLELEPHQIAVQLVTPGFVDTGMTEGLPLRMPMKLTAPHAADIILAQLGRKDVFEIELPYLFVRAIKGAHWLLPRRWFLMLTERFHLPTQK